MMMTMRTILPVLAAAALAACDGGTVATLRTPAALEVVSGDGQEGTAGATLHRALSVRVVDDEGHPLAGYTVSFVVTSGGGEVEPGADVSGADGRASASWALGPSTAESQRVEARVEASGGTVLSAVFQATPQPGPAEVVAPVGETSFTGITGASLPVPLRVRVTDALGNPHPGGTVVWQVREGDGTLSNAAQTDADGVASATWTLGPLAAEPQRAEARFRGTVVAFTASALPPADVVVTTEGSGQSAPVGTAFPAPLELRARLADGRAVSRLPVEWSGDGVLSPTGVTDANGRARNEWSATALGPLTARATVRTAGGPVTVEWTGTGTAPAPYELRAVGGLPEKQAAGQPARPGVRVRVTEAGGSPAAGVTVHWAVTAGGGTVSAETSLSDAQGFATTEWTMGPPGPQALHVWLDGAPEGLTYTATAEADTQ